MLKTMRDMWKKISTDRSTKDEERQPLLVDGAPPANRDEMLAHTQLFVTRIRQAYADRFIDNTFYSDSDRIASQNEFPVEIKQIFNECFPKEVRDLRDVQIQLEEIKDTLRGFSQDEIVNCQIEMYLHKTFPKIASASFRDMDAAPHVARQGAAVASKEATKPGAARAARAAHP